MMSTRAAYTIFEQTVIALYDRGVLNQDFLDTLACMYRGMQVDSAGSKRLRANDGKDMQQVCIALVNPAFPLVESGVQDDDDEYWEKELNEWVYIINTRWGWD